MEESDVLRRIEYVRAGLQAYIEWCGGLLLTDEPKFFKGFDVQARKAQILSELLGWLEGDNDLFSYYDFKDLEDVERLLADL